MLYGKLPSVASDELLSRKSSHIATLHTGKVSVKHIIFLDDYIEAGLDAVNTRSISNKITTATSTHTLHLYFT